MIKDKHSYALVAAVYRRAGANRWTCEHSSVEPLRDGEIWNDRDESHFRHVGDDRVEVRATFRAEPQGDHYVALVPMQEAQDAADRAFRAGMPGVQLDSVERPGDAELVNQ